MPPARQPLRDTRRSTNKKMTTETIKSERPRKETYELKVPLFWPHHDRRWQRRELVHRAPRPLDGIVIWQRPRLHLGALKIGIQPHLVKGEPSIHEGEHPSLVEAGDDAASGQPGARKALQHVGEDIEPHLLLQG